ncbi:VOC family protein [Phytomonospora sp. NPDC050363]|uniref:bleomycin resistance protein n=1 Tax=Phytomonospora sp. NPDC050363 TaxID=3155642 RepID=UPI0033E0D0B9
MVTFTRVSPVLPVGDLSASVAHYRALGFTVETYAGEAEYAFARRGGIELHLSRVDGLEPDLSVVSAYLYVDDAEELSEEWSRSGASGRFVPPVDTDYGLREGAHIDPDGNLLRYGSPLKQ